MAALHSQCDPRWSDSAGEHLMGPTARGNVEGTGWRPPRCAVESPKPARRPRPPGLCQGRGGSGAPWHPSTIRAPLDRWGSATRDLPRTAQNSSAAIRPSSSQARRACQKGSWGMATVRAPAPPQAPVRTGRGTRVSRPGQVAEHPFGRPGPDGPPRLPLSEDCRPRVDIQQLGRSVCTARAMATPQNRDKSPKALGFVGRSPSDRVGRAGVSRSAGDFVG